MKSARDCWATPRPTAALVRAAAFTIATAVHLAFDVIGPLAPCSMFEHRRPTMAHTSPTQYAPFSSWTTSGAPRLHSTSLVESLRKPRWGALKFGVRKNGFHRSSAWQEQRTLQNGKLRMDAMIIIPAAQRVSIEFQKWNVMTDVTVIWQWYDSDMTVIWQWYGSVSKPGTLVNIKIAGKWMFIPLKMVSIGIDPYPYARDYRMSHGIGAPSLFEPSHTQSAVGVKE